MSWLVFNSTAVMFASIFLFLILIAAALPKIRHQDEFQGVVANYKLLPAFMVAPASRMLPWIEIGSALMLLISQTRVLGALMSAGLFMIFSLALAVNVGRGRTHIDCGCTRRPASKSRIGMFHVVRALSLAAVSLYVATVPLDFAALSFESGLLGMVAAAMLAIIYLAADVFVGLPAVRTTKS